MQKMALVAIFKAHAHALALAEKTAVSGGNGHGSRGAKQTRCANKALINGLILTKLLRRYAEHAKARDSSLHSTWQRRVDDLQL